MVSIVAYLFQLSISIFIISGPCDNADCFGVEILRLSHDQPDIG